MFILALPYSRVSPDTPVPTSLPAVGAYTCVDFGSGYVVF